MSKYIKIDDNLIINAEIIYAIQRIPKSVNLLDEWNEKVEARYNEIMSDKPSLLVGDNTIEYGSEDYMYYAHLEAEQEYEDEKPENKISIIYKYSVMLNTGVNVNIDKSIYDKIIENLNLK